MIPKKIHYCWFGGNPIDVLGKKCIESWRKFFPDYEIIEWNESNFDINSCQYVKEAYSVKKWAFVSDYARFKILYEYGGVYFDTDVEVTRPFEDILKNGNFMAREDKENVNPGLGLACIPKLSFIKDILDDYEQSHFIKEDGTYDLTTIVERTTKILKKNGLTDTDKIQSVKDINIYPTEYFCPQNFLTGEMKITDNTHSIHHYSASWYGETEKRSFELKRKFAKYMPRRFVGILATAIAKCEKEGIKSCVNWILSKIKRRK